jgi:hypothetical protein
VTKRPDRRNHGAEKRFALAAVITGLLVALFGLLAPAAPGVQLSRTPGSGGLQLRDPSGSRTDPFGNPVARRNPGNHYPYVP